MNESGETMAEKRMPVTKREAEAATCQLEMATKWIRRCSVGSSRAGALSTQTPSSVSRERAMRLSSRRSAGPYFVFRASRELEALRASERSIPLHTLRPSAWFLSALDNCQQPTTSEIHPLTRCPYVECTQPFSSAKRNTVTSRSISVPTAVPTTRTSSVSSTLLPQVRDITALI